MSCDGYVCMVTLVQYAEECGCIHIGMHNKKRIYACADVRVYGCTCVDSNFDKI